MIKNVRNVMEIASDVSYAMVLTSVQYVKGQANVYFVMEQVKSNVKHAKAQASRCIRGNKYSLSPSIIASKPPSISGDVMLCLHPCLLIASKSP